jgi:hypothetical protein
MRLCTGEAGAQFAFFSGLCATCGATNREGQFLLGFHDFHNERLPRNKMFNSDQSEIFREPIISAETVEGHCSNSQELQVSNMSNMFNQSATDANKVPAAPLTNSEVLPDSERDKQPRPLDPAYKPFDQESALRKSPYKPYSDKPWPNEPPYEPYKGM